MGFNLEKINFALRALLLVGFLSLFMIRCGDNGQTQHFKYLGLAEWSPVNNNSLLITKDEYDLVTGKKSACSNAVEDATPPPINYNLFLADSNGSVVKQLTQNLFLSTQVRVKWSPLGDRVAVYGNPSSNFFIVYTNGSGVLAADSIGYTVDADWSPDGSRLICSAMRRGATNNRTSIYIVAASNGHCTRLNQDTASTGVVAWSSQNILAYAFASNGTSALVAADTSGNILHDVDSAGYFYVARWSPDGSTLLYSKTDGNVTTDAVEWTFVGESRLPLLHYADNTAILSMRYSPDGTMISVYTGQASTYSVYVYNADGTNARLVAALSTDASWSPDSKQLAYVYYNAVQRKRIQ